MAGLSDTKLVAAEADWKSSTERALMNTENILRSLSNKDRWREPLAPIGGDSGAGGADGRAGRGVAVLPSEAMRNEVLTRDVEKRMGLEVEKRLEAMQTKVDAAREEMRRESAGRSEELSELRTSLTEERERRQRAERDLAGMQRNHEDTKEALDVLRRRVEEGEEARAADRRDARREAQRRQVEAAGAAEELRTEVDHMIQARHPGDDAVVKAQVAASVERIARLETDRGAAREEIISLARAAKADAKEEALGAVEELITCMGEKIRTNIAAAIEDRLALVPEQAELQDVRASVDRLQAHAADAQAGVARVGEVVAGVRARAEASDARASQEAAEVARLHARLKEVVQVMGAMSARLSGGGDGAGVGSASGKGIPAFLPSSPEASMVDAKVAGLHAEFDRRFKDISAAMRDISAAVRPQSGGQSRERTPPQASSRERQPTFSPPHVGAIYSHALPAPSTFDDA